MPCAQVNRLCTNSCFCKPHYRALTYTISGVSSQGQKVTLTLMSFSDAQASQAHVWLGYICVQIIIAYYDRIWYTLSQNAKVLY
jgi:hypothetical protein